MSVSDSAVEDESARGKGGIQARSVVRWWVGALVAYLLVIPTHVLPNPAAQLVTDIAWTIASVLAALSTFRTAGSLRHAERTAWLLFGCGNAAWAAGQIVWDVYHLVLGVAVPFPSLADVGYLSFGPLMIAGLLVLRSTQQARRLTWLRVANLGLILSGLAVILIVMLTQPFKTTDYQMRAALVIVGESASITVAAIIAMYLLWSYEWGSRLTSMALVTTALVLHTVAGVFYTRELIAQEYIVAGALDVLWLLGFAFQHLAARSRLAVAMGADDAYSSDVIDKHGWVEALLPAALLLCMASSATGLIEELTPRMVFLGSVMLGAFAIVLALREALMYSHGLQTQAKLQAVSNELVRTNEELQSLGAQRSELEREIEITARAGGVGLWDWDMRTPVVRFSRGWKHQLGYAEDEIADHFEEWRSRLHPEDVDRMTKAVADFVADPQGEFVAEQRLRHRDGSYRWILARGGVVKDAEGRALRMIGSHVDITERKTFELSLRDSEARYRELVDELETRVAARTSELSEAYRESRNFAYAVAHDLKAPLRAIDGFSHLLDDSVAARLTEEERGYIARVRRGAIHMASLIDGLLDYSRLEHRELRLDTVDLQSCCEEIVGSMESLIQASGANVILDLPLRQVHADAEGLRIVIRNLLDNALKFRSTERSCAIAIGSYRDAGNVVLTLRDNGIGFDPQYREKIFEIFNRLHATGYGGTGIGLALVRKAVQRMHGRIWAESQLDQGATFYVSLPCAADGDDGDRQGDS